MFARKVNSVFDKLLPSRKARPNNKNDANSFKVDDKVFFLAYMDAKEMWKDDIIATRIWKLIYMIKRKRSGHKRYHNQLKKRFNR